MAGTQNVGEASDNPVAINVTAMVDVIFCLCLFFMCSFHFKQLEGRIDTWLPNKGDRPNVPAPELIKDEVRVLLRWNPATRTTDRHVMSFDVAENDEVLMSQVRQVADGLEARGNDRWPLIVDARNDVPWQDVVHVLDLSKARNIQRLEFAAPEIDMAPVERQ